MPIEFDLECTDIDGINRTFLCRIIDELNGNNITVSVHFVPPLPSGDFFQVTIHRLNLDTAITTAIYSHDQEYRGKGIPEALLPWISNHLNTTVVSSSNRNPRLNGERRSEEATKMWERLCRKRIAKKLEDSDHYEILR